MTASRGLIAHLEDKAQAIEEGDRAALEDLLELTTKAIKQIQEIRNAAICRAFGISPDTMEKMR